MDLNFLVWWAVFGASLTSFLADLRAHWINRDFLEFAGSYELEIGSKLSLAYFSAMYGLVLISLGMAFWRELPFSSELSELILGFVLMMLGFLGRQWAIRSIGRLWSLKCLYIPSMPLENRGLYRFLSHPEYLCRGIESLGVLIVLGTKELLWPLWICVMILSLVLALTEKRFLSTYADSFEDAESNEAF
jgi:isoprenylcysteine carboxyl methyltransferase (ICMT) family protein YpbQ